MQLKGFIGPAYTLQSSNIQAQRCVNLYPQLDESGTGKNVAALLGTPGLKGFAVLYDDAANAFFPVRGMITTAKSVPNATPSNGVGRLFVVVDTKLYEISESGEKTDCGTLSSSAGFVGIADNGQQLLLVDGPNGYSYDLVSNTPLTPIVGFEGGTAPDGATAAFLDGFFIYNEPGTQKFHVSNPYTTTFDATNFASAEGSPDDLITLLSDHELLWLFGTTSTEVWYNAGGDLFPFQRMQSGNIQFGIAAARTAARFASSVVWLSRDENGQGIVVQANGLQPQRITTHAIEQAIASYSRIDDATAYTYQQDGHNFYVLNFPTGNATWVYDSVTQLWHERAYTAQLGLEVARGAMHTEAFGKHIVADYQRGWLYQLDRFTLCDEQYNGTDWKAVPITRKRAAPYISDELKNLFISQLQLDMQTGLGSPSADPGATPPQIVIRWSDDGGHTWSNEYQASLGASGGYTKRVIWRRLGRTRQRIFEVTITDAVFVAINDAFISTTEGTS